LCGNDPDDAHLKRLLRATASKKLAIAFQRKGAAGAERFIISKSRPQETPSPELLSADGVKSAAALSDFLRWGLETLPAQHTALILGGQAADATAQSPFSFCGDDLTPLKLQQALALALEDADLPKIDLLGFDMETAQVIELAYQISDCADWMVGAPPNAPHPAWNYGKFITACHKAHQKNADLSPQKMADLLASGVKNASALNLNRLEDVVRIFDALTMAMLQSLGDDIIWDVVWDAEAKIAFNFDTTADRRPLTAADSEQTLPPSSFILHPFVDLSFLLKTLQTRFEQASKDVMDHWRKYKPDKLTSREQKLTQALSKLADPSSEEEDRILARLPEWKVTEYRLMRSQSKRAEELAELAQRAWQAVNSVQGEMTGRQGAVSGQPSAVSLFCPQDLRQASRSDYASLAFNRRVHWAALLGAISLIAEHPRALWRLTSSLLTTSDSVVRENLLRRVIGPDSVMVGFREQFRALASSPKLTLSLESIAPSHSKRSPAHSPTRSPASLYRLRLETYDTGPTVLEQNSLVNTRSIENALGELERLLKDPWANPNALRYLDSLGKTLGEDIIQKLNGALYDARRQAAQLSDAAGAPHLQLQLPRSLMRYPWELMHDEHGLLCDRYALGRQIFMEVGTARQITRRRDGVIRALIIGDPKLNPDFLKRARQQGQSWTQLPGAAEEAEQVALAFKRLSRALGKAVDFQYERDLWIHKPLSKLKFRELLRDGHYDIIHFAGHALFTPDLPEQSAWILSDGPLWAQEIHNTLRRVAEPPWLVFANACEAAMDSGKRDNRYQGNVFGLASAFINQGTAAYIAPLWPINDAVAQQMSIDFYYSLLLDYTSLGEALRRAKQEARRSVAGDSFKTEAAPNSAQISLSWASLVLYGDPAASLMQSLWTPHHLPPVRPSTVQQPERLPSRRKPLRRPRRPLQASVEETLALASGPGMTSLPTDALRGAETIPPDKIRMELVEVKGLRYWQSSDGRSSQPAPLPGSIMKDVLANADVQRALGAERGVIDYARIIGRWLIDGKGESLVKNLVAQYDRDMVSQEKLWLVAPDASLRDMPAVWPGNASATTDRTLLIIHGTFSKSASPVNGLKGDFLDWAMRHYQTVIAFDHWTLSKSPEENAKHLWQLLPPNLRKGSSKLDIVTHSRGGLIARAFVELPRHHRLVNKVVFVCTPNSGTSLASPANWGRAADSLINMVHLDNLGMFGRLSGFLARLSALGTGVEAFYDKLLRQIPGLAAQNPQSLGPRDFLGRLQRGEGPPAGVSYAAIAANYEAPPREINIHSLSKKESLKTKGEKSADTALDPIFGASNDLIVDTAHVWAVDLLPNEAMGNTAPAWLPGQRLLIYTPDRAMPTPANAAIQYKAGVHHTNVFLHPETHRFLKAQLS
ncbi:MAG TPA: CHAT domain-containing protein, partial [Chloroflexi bacterium]|nr:CHAT domain-containing protein [Chloroflexota bacterium]